MMNRYFFLAMAVTLSVAACEKGGPAAQEGPGSGNERPEEINGTEIMDGVNAAGLVSDASTGKGIPGVPVTDGYTYTLTDENGVYQMEASRYCRNIYYSLPAEYNVALDEEYGQPAFYSTATFNYKQFNRNDFTLVPRTENTDEFTLVAIADPQCRNASEADRFITETLADISGCLSSGEHKEVYAITLGDIVHDTPEMWGTMKKSMAGVTVNGKPLPIWQTIGNHDHSALENSQYNAVRNFVTWFGPTDYSFNIGKVHIVSMDNMICKSTSGKTWSYDAGFSSSQMKWLEQDLEAVSDKEDKMVILCVHIPFRNGQASGGGSVNTDKHHDDVLELLSRFKEAHILAGHRHFSQNWVHKDRICKGGLPVYEHIHAAACGAFWSCDSNLDGSPNGYSIYEISGAGMKNWKAKATGREEDFQMRVYDGNQVYTGDNGYTYTWYGGGTGGSSKISAKGYPSLEGCFVAHIWNADDTYWTVELYRDGAKVGDMQKVPDGSCSNACSTSFFFNQLDKNGTDYRIFESCPYWYFRPASGTPLIEQGWEVRATQTIPGSGTRNIYSATVLQKDYTGF